MKTIVTTLALIVFPMLCFSGELTIKKGVPFESVRTILLKNNWRPIDVHSGQVYEYIGVENNLKRRGFTEVENCAIDKPICVFNYKKKNKCLRLVTSGERIRLMKVSEWSNDCPLIAGENKQEDWHVLGTDYRISSVATGVIPGDQYSETLCQGFTMSEDNLRKFLQRVRSIKPDELHDKFEGAPCFVKASLMNGKHTAVLEVRASGIGTLELDGTAPIDIGCDKCDDILAEKLP